MFKKKKKKGSNIGSCPQGTCVIALCFVCPMLPVSLDFPFLLAPSVFSNVYYESDVQCRLYQPHCICKNILSNFPLSHDLSWNKVEKKYNTVRTVPKSNRNIKERGRINTSNTQIYDNSLS